MSKNRSLWSIDGAGIPVLSPMTLTSRMIPETIWNYSGNRCHYLLSIAATDSKDFSDISENVWFYVPARLMGFHDINERIAISDYQGAIAFYYQLIKNLNREK